MTSLGTDNLDQLHKFQTIRMDRLAIRPVAINAHPDLVCPRIYGKIQDRLLDINSMDFRFLGRHEICYLAVKERIRSEKCKLRNGKTSRISYITHPYSENTSNFDDPSSMLSIFCTASKGFASDASLSAACVCVAPISAVFEAPS